MPLVLILISSISVIVIIPYLIGILMHSFNYDTENEIWFIGFIGFIGLLLIISSLINVYKIIYDRLK